VRYTVDPPTLAVTGEEEFPLIEDANAVARELEVEPPP
jgi:hypothetical protein